VAATVFGALVAGCAGGGDDSDARSEPADRGSVVQALAEDVIVPGQERLAASTRDLATATAELCATPQAATFEAARSAWAEAASAWASTAAYRIGPVDSARLGPRISYEVDPDKVAAFAQDVDQAELLTPESLQRRGADQRGLEAVEQLLLTPSDVSELTTRQCAYAASASALIAGAAEELLAAWVDGIDGDSPAQQQLTEPGGDGMWSSDTEALEDLLNSSLAALNTISDMQLGPALDASDASPDQRMLSDVRDELDSVAAVFGDAGATPPSGLAALVAAQADAAAADRIAAQLRSAIAEVDAAEVDAAAGAAGASGSTGQAERAALERADEHARAAATALRTEVASLLGLTVSFSDADGDG
jgi:predicted lipoprotein